MTFASLVPASISTRVAVALLTIGAVALAGAGVTFRSQATHDASLRALGEMQGSLPLVERVRGGAYAVVMESRGIYIARDAGQALGFATNLRAHLADIEASWAALRPVLPPETAEAAARLEAPLRDFVALRRELAKVAVEQGAQAADLLGNNDANRSARTRFTAALDALPPLVIAAVEQRRAEIAASGRRLSATVLGGTAAAVLLVVGLALWLMQRGVVRPLRALERGLRSMAEGRLDVVELPPAGPGEVGGIAGTAVVFLEALRRNRVLEATSAAEHAARDRRQAAMDQLTQDFGTAVSGVLGQLGNSAQGMRGTAAEMAETAGRTHGDMVVTAGEADLSANGLSTVAGATEELTASVGEIARRVTEAARTAGRAVEQARTTDRTVQGLSEAAGRIGEVVRLIGAIAAQTNLLALNATIEAARAGEAGRGFAVVASEVKNLATQTTEATGRIAEQVSAIQAATGEAVSAVRGVAAAIEEVSETAAAIATAVDEQGAATREIAHQVQGVAAATGRASRTMQDAAAMAERSGDASRTVLGTAEGVAQLTGTLRQEVDHFLIAMRKSGTDDERRRYERVPGRDAPTRLRSAARGTGEGRLVDISLGGAAIACEWPCDIGMETLIGLPGGEDFVSARIVSGREGVLAIAFRQDPVTLERVTRALDAVTALPMAA